MEGASPVGFAFQPDPAFHQLYQSRGDSQAQACPSILARGRAVCLHESLKNPLMFFLRDADAGIADAKMQDGPIRLMRFHLDLQVHFAMLRELDGVPH